MKIDFKEYKDKEYASYLWQPLWKLRTKLIKHLKEHGILAVFHYLSLHSSPYYQNKHDGRELPECDRYADCLVRLPMYYNLKDEDVIKICKLINNYASDN